ncbi:MAG: hypothetical protein HFF93_04870 [Oscillibacter sp.]|nr:hypothetical protein [Oscillibacter sp.]
MTREELFRAVGEVREDQIEAAEIVKKQIHPWRRFGALAACLALVVTAAAAPELREADHWKWTAIVKSFNPMSSCLAWLSPEEIFAQDTVIFRGTVRELHYFMVEPDAGPMERYYTRALVEVTDSIRGGLKAGETYSLLWLGARGYMSTSISGALEDLDVGSDAVFMPIRTGQDTGWREGDLYFCYADLAEFYLSEGTRYVFADTAEGLVFDRSTYEEIAGAETLDEIAAYIREQIGEEEPQRWVVIGEEEEPESGGYVFVEGTEQTQPAAVPAAPQTEPSETVNAGPSASGPSGALELPGGAYVSE